MKETPVDFNPFEQKPALTETPVDGNPFGEQPPHTNIVKDGLGPQNPNALQPETPIAVPKPLLDRLANTYRTDKQIAAFLKGGIEGAIEGFGHETIGLKPEEEKRLQEWGLLRDPNAPNSSNPLRLQGQGFIDGTINTTAGVIDTVLRAMRAGSYAVAGALAKYEATRSGMDETEENRLKRDLVIINDVSMAIQQPIPHKMTRTRRGTMGEVIEETVSAVPRTEKDFSDAATAIGAPDPHVQAKLQKLYEEKGVLPAEAFGDADRNPVTKQEILSNTNDLPERYGPEKPNVEFQTAKGSTYTIHEDGTTTRNKAARDDLGHEGDFGPKERSERTVYLSEDAARALATPQGNWRIVEHTDGTFSVATKNADGQWGISPDSRNISVSNTPSPGSIPLELWGKENIYGSSAYRTAHFGNKIVEGGSLVGGGGSQPPVIPPKRNVGPGDGSFEPPKKGSLAEAQEHILSKMSIGERPGFDYSFDKFYRDAVDRFYMLEKATDPLDLSVWEDAYKLTRMHGGWAGKADEMINHATFDFFGHKNNGVSLAEIFKDIKASVKNLDEFRAFAGAARAAETEIRGKSSGYDWDKIKIVGDARTKKMTDAFEKLVDYQNRLSAYARDAGFMSQKVFDEMIANNRAFIPLHEYITEAMSGHLGNSQVFKKLTGGDMKYVDPLETIIKNTYALIEAADRNYAKMQLVDKLFGEGKAAKGTEVVVHKPNEVPAKYGHNQGPNASEFLEKTAGVVDAPELSKQMKEWAAPRLADDEVVVFRNGKREVHHVDPEIAKAINRTDKEAAHWLINMLAAPASVVRSGIVLAPEFGVKFLMRDSIYAAMTTVHGVVHPGDVLKAIGSMIIRDADFHNWLKSGAGDVSPIAMDRNRAQQTLNRLNSDPNLFMRTWNLVIDPDASMMDKAKELTKDIAGSTKHAATHPVESVGRVFKTLIHPMQAFTDLALSTPHLAGYKKRMRQLEKEYLKENPGAAEAIADFPKGEFRMKDGMTVYDAQNVYNQVLRAPTKEKQMLLEAGWASRNTSADGQRYGARTQALNSITIFSQARIQDIDILVRQLSNPKTAAKAFSVIAASIVLPSAALWYANKDDPRYKQIPQHEKDNDWHILTDKWENVNPKFQEALFKVRDPSDFRLYNGMWQVNNGTIYRYKKPFTPGVFFGSGIERLMEAYFNEKGMSAFDGFGKQLQDSIVGDFTPTAFGPIWEQATNRGFGGRTIIPAYLEKQLPEYQYYNNTTELSKAIGKTLSAVPGIAQYRLPSHDGTVLGGIAKAATSPILIENYVRGYTGTMGDYIFRALDKGLRAVGALPDPIKPDLALADIPFVRAFVSRYPTMSSDAVQSIYNEAKDMKQHFDTFMSKAQTGDKEAMDRVMQMGGQRMWLQIDKQMEAITAQAAIVRQINQGVEKKIITPSDGRQHIDIIYFQMIQTGKSLKEQLDRIKEPSPK